MILWVVRNKKLSLCSIIERCLPSETVTFFLKGNKQCDLSIGDTAILCIRLDNGRISTPQKSFSQLQYYWIILVILRIQLVSLHGAILIGDTLFTILFEQCFREINVYSIAGESIYPFSSVPSPGIRDKPQI